MKYKTILTLITTGISFIHAIGQVQMSAEYSTFIVKENNSGILTDSLLENKLNDVTGDFKGGKLILSDIVGIGIGLSTIYFQKEIQGFFPHSNQYGLAVIKGSTSYWSFPISISSPAFNGKYNKKYSGQIRYFHTKFEFSYIPSIINNSSVSTFSTIGSAINSSFVSDYPDHSKVFQHSLLFSIKYELPLVGGAGLNVGPYIGMGSKYYKNSGGSACVLNYGINFSLRFYIPSITIERCPTYNNNNKHNEMKKRELQKKQREIEEKLKNKPN